MASRKFCRDCYLSFFVLAVLYLEMCLSQSVVEFLPGFQGPLPFYLETGYVGVGESEDVQLFYYFIKSQTNSKEDPLLLWLSGGPGCSVLSAILYGIGPVNVKYVKYNGSLPTLELSPYPWTQISNILFIDSPRGTGFSYSRTPSLPNVTDTEHIRCNYEFLKKWLNTHSEFLSNPLYVAGDSYSGMIVPGVVQQILDGNENMKPMINFQGYILGNPVTDRHLESNLVIPFAHGMGYISDELYESLKRSCGGEYTNVDPSNAECLKNVQAADECLDRINGYHVLEPKCAGEALKQDKANGKRRFLYKKPLEILDPDELPEFGCRAYRYLLSYYWANDDDVRRALRVRKGSIGSWVRCDFHMPYTHDIHSSFEYHVKLSRKGYRSLIYSGDHDKIVPFLSTQAWIRNLNYSIVDDWRPWIVQGQVAGYTRTYSNNMTFATLKGGAHIAPDYQPKECFTMFKRWISKEQL